MQDHISQSMEQRHDRLLGNYRILRMLGQGSFADVYLGEHIHLHTQAAIKVLQVRLVESNIQSFLNEARTIAHMVHPYIIRVLDFGVEANTPFLVMDYAPQGTFRQRFLQGNPLPPTALFPFIKQAASALQYAHDKKLIHRDVKPENMLLGPNEEILLSDFGFAVIQTSLTRPSIETAGTASYMAPEQFQGKPHPASDQYSLGIIAYEWLTGTCPFQGTFMELASQHIMTQPPSLIQRVPGLSAQIAQVVMTALAKEPDQRFPSVRDFARALEHACLNSNNHLTADSPIMPPPFLSKPPSSQTNYTSLARPNQNPQPILNSEHKQPDEAQTHFRLVQQSPIHQSSPNGFSSALTAGSYTSAQAGADRGETLSLRVGETFRQESTLSSSSSIFPAFPQSILNPVEPAQSSPWANSPRPTTASTRPTAPNMLNATEHLSQSGLPPLQLQPMNQDRSELTNALKPSPVKSSEQSFSFTSFPSQANLPALPDLPHLPQQPFLGPELAGQNSSVSMAPQTFPSSQNVSIRTRALSRNFPAPDADSWPQPDLLDLNESLPTSNSQSPQLVRAENFRKTAKSSTSGVLSLFIVSMVVLIIGSTAFLVVLTNKQHQGLKASQSQSTPHTHATAVTTPQQTTPTPEPTTAEPNPYGNHNGILVLNDPLNQQDPQMPWDELPGTCSFSTDGYHVVVTNPQSQEFTLCSAATSDYANFVYQVQMTFTKVTGTAASGGIAFRGTKASKQFYFFEIFTTGDYHLYRCPGPNGAGCPLLSSSVTNGGPIPSFHANLNQPNTIALLANGNAFSLYVNNQLAVGPIVDTTADSTYTHGTIGMVARQTSANAETDVVFNNIKMWKM